jgi:Cu(I)/Ag(I) efflux system membrane fusion protein
LKPILLTNIDMKSNLRSINLCIIATLALALTACGGSGKESGGHSHGEGTHAHDGSAGHAHGGGDQQSIQQVSQAKMEAPQAFQQHLKGVVDDYLKVKNAFVESDNDKAQKAAAGLITRLSETKDSQLSAEAKNSWQSYKKQMMSAAKQIQSTAGLAEQRKAFEELSMALNQSVEQFGIKGMKLYVQHCPMAFNNKGADWMSSEKQISNPYFGDEMLRCGTNKRALAFNSSKPSGSNKDAGAQSDEKQ